MVLKRLRSDRRFYFQGKAEPSAYVRSGGPLPLFGQTDTSTHVVRNLGEISATDALPGEPPAPFASALKNVAALCDQVREKSAAMLLTRRRREKPHLTRSKMSSHSDHYTFSVKLIGYQSGFGVQKSTFHATPGFKTKNPPLVNEVHLPVRWFWQLQHRRRRRCPPRPRPLWMPGSPLSSTSRRVSQSKWKRKTKKERLRLNPTPGRATYPALERRKGFAFVVWKRQPIPSAAPAVRVQRPAQRDPLEPTPAERSPSTTAGPRYRLWAGPARGCPITARPKNKSGALRPIGTQTLELFPPL